MHWHKYIVPGMQRLGDEGLEECRDIQTDEMMTIAIKLVIVPILYCHNTLVMSVLLHHLDPIGHCA